MNGPGAGIQYSRTKNCWQVRVSNIDGKGGEESSISRTFGLTNNSDAKYDSIKFLVESLHQYRSISSDDDHVEEFLKKLRINRVLTSEDLNWESEAVEEEFP